MSLLGWCIFVFLIIANNCMIWKTLNYFKHWNQWSCKMSNHCNAIKVLKQFLLITNIIEGVTALSSTPVMMTFYFVLWKHRTSTTQEGFQAGQDKYQNFNARKRGSQSPFWRRAEKQAVYMLAHSHFMLGLIQLNAEDSKEYNIPVSQRGIMLQSLK